MRKHSRVAVGQVAKQAPNMRTKRYLAVLLVLVLGSCSEESNSPTKAAGAGDPRRGKAVYMANCAACHNPDPSRDGSIGPALKGTPRDVLAARVLKGSYPPGYAPKRQTSLMPAQPYLESAIPDLAAFLE